MRRDGMDQRIEETERIFGEMRLCIERGDVDGMRALVDELDGLTESEPAEDGTARTTIGR
jgi:hypothetical protein